MKFLDQLLCTYKNIARGKFLDANSWIGHAQMGWKKHGD
jgi:hypothetical protein